MPFKARMIITGVVVVLILGGWGWSLTHADLLDDAGSGVSVPITVGQAGLFGVTAGPRHEVVLRHAAAHVRVNTAGAQIRVVLCDGLREGGVLGASRGKAASACTSLTPVAGARLRPISSEVIPQLLVEVTPRHVGDVVIDGVDVAYRAGIRWGWQRTGPTITLHVTAAAPR